MTVTQTITAELDAFNEYVNFAKKYSLFYPELYKPVSTSDGDLNIPVTDHAKYWVGNECLNSKVMTGTHIDGIVLRTGGICSNLLFSS